MSAEASLGGTAVMNNPDLHHMVICKSCGRLGVLEKMVCQWCKGLSYVVFHADRKVVLSTVNEIRSQFERSPLS